MRGKLPSIIDTLINLLFPQRKDEKIVTSITPAEISTLPLAKENLDGIYSLYSYRDPRVQALIWELKYHRNTKAVSIIGSLLAEHLIEELSEESLFGNFDHPLLVPIPITSKRLRERKFSQTDLLCREILTHTNKTITYSPAALRKIKETPKQSWSKSREERLHNLYKAFEADGKLVSGKNIIIIDDVTTTGATIAEAVRALKVAGAKNVIAFTIAH